MFSAYDREGRKVCLLHYNNEEIKGMREKTFSCPDCGDPVILKTGNYVTPHFSHKPNKRCRHHVEGGEGKYHENGKRDLYYWFQQQGIFVKLEYYIRRIKQRPDLLVKWENKYYAIEFQCSTIPGEVIVNRSRQYLSIGIHPIWLIGMRRISYKSDHIIMQRFEWLFFQKLSKESISPRLLSYCPNVKRCLLFDEPYPYKRKVYGSARIQPLHRFTFAHWFQNIENMKSSFINKWFEIKKMFRLTVPKRLSRQEQIFRNWLYEKGFHPQQLPAYINVPISSHYKIETPLYIWQAFLCIGFIKDQEIGETFTYNQCLEYVERWIMYRNIPFYHDDKEPIYEYLLLLQHLGIIETVGKYTFMKVDNIHLYELLEEALRQDALILQRLQV
ncbi:competence protein CoiA [Salirhabdus salicampi]|uniref:competence protein CoiA n=1 Tax=Salirhabdus salicampi TaxID=476102 RepID=UPI0020C2A45A|nr:competence protein CoiA family protein [Salirhabdus salicampi]MCP8615586.1 competence protein CoiA [Salirhabdus salicampi]